MDPEWLIIVTIDQLYEEQNSKNYKKKDLDIPVLTWTYTLKIANKLKPGEFTDCDRICLILIIKSLII